MSTERRAGEPGPRPRPAGAPPDPSGPAGVPDQDRAPAPEQREVPSEERRVEADLDQLLDETKRERDEYLDLARRTKADFENYRRRAAREAQEAERRGKADLVKPLVPVLDNLERALRAAGIDPDADQASAGSDGPGSDDGGGLGHGVRLVYRELRAALASAGVEDYDPEGARFDPEWHEALATRPAEGTEPGTVIETLEKGYRLDGQILRPARVVVSQ